jgi:hypothetical protein
LSEDYRAAQHLVDFHAIARHMAAIEAHGSVNRR